MGTPAPVVKRVWPNGRPELGMVHAPECERDRLKWTATACPCGHVQTVVAHGRTEARLAEVRVHVVTYTGRLA